METVQQHEWKAWLDGGDNKIHHFQCPQCHKHMRTIPTTENIRRVEYLIYGKWIIQEPPCITRNPEQK
jgi:hypothetical protein